MRPPPFPDFRYSGIEQGTHFFRQVDPTKPGWVYGRWLRHGGPVEWPDRIGTTLDTEVVGRYGFDPLLGVHTTQLMQRLETTTSPIDPIPPQYLDLLTYENNTVNPGFTQTVQYTSSSTNSLLADLFYYPGGSGLNFLERAEVRHAYVAANPFEPWYDMRSFGDVARYERLLLAIGYDWIVFPPNYSPDRFELGYEWHPDDRLELTGWDLFFLNASTATADIVTLNATETALYGVGTSSRFGYWSGVQGSPDYHLSILNPTTYTARSGMSGLDVIDRIPPNTVRPLNLLKWRGDQAWHVIVDQRLGYPSGYKTAPYMSGAGMSDERPTGGIVTLNANAYQYDNRMLGYVPRSGVNIDGFGGTTTAVMHPGFTVVSARFRFPRFRWAIRPLLTPPLRQRQRGDGMVLGDQRQYVRGNPKSLQRSVRQLWSGSFL